ncbi:hypothetical protein MB02_03610 [Croceicoccus estronivorus]|uniref:hypothetical protein n=1 Tax=Croceicoccus estronivorus TaxID=1172626 RepID=UPI000836DE99|nr:hypothetical protein [Croceicoccus estronivorus]OCC24587.1 hypothetical protein MB02_03610 [Croceicoccus estronivorus]
MRYFAVVVLALLAACNDPLTPEERAARDERDIAMVVEANAGSAIPIAPQPILYPDIQANSLYGTGCAFVASDGGLGAVMLARIGDGYMKLDDNLIRFAADKGSGELPFGAHARYAGKKYSLELDLASDEGRQTATERVDYNGRLSVRDQKGHIVYDKNGMFQCGS